MNPGLIHFPELIQMTPLQFVATVSPFRYKGALLQILFVPVPETTAVPI